MLSPLAKKLNKHSRRKLILFLRWLHIRELTNPSPALVLTSFEAWGGREGVAQYHWIR